VLDIPEADPAVDKDHHDEMRRQLIEAVGVPNKTIRLGPNVVLDFSEVTNEDEPPLLQFGPCVTLTSVAHFEPGADPTGQAAPGAAVPTLPQARSPRSLGPLLRFGPHRKGARTFLEVRCFPDNTANDGVRISGFRIHGPSFGQQSTGEFGIRVIRCVNVEISNMEIAGFGGVGVSVLDDTGPDQGPADNPTNGPGGRISHPAQVKVFGNYIHHNQQPAESWLFGGHAGGYGVESDHGAWVEITENVFDSNRHAIAAAGDAGGYDAVRNLVLKGGGYHGTWYNEYTHIFDVHGTGCWWSSDLCGDAGTRFLYSHNAFQYRRGPAINIRGRPLSGVFITHNIFPHDGLEDDWGDDAIHLQTSRNVTIGPGNEVEFDAFGKYGVCDFDGDQIDDLFLPTGKTWWYSSFGEFPWTFLNVASERIDRLRLGYFDDDLVCDVLAESGGEWRISSGGRGMWKSIGAFGAPLAEVAFGRFDPNVRDHRPGATRRTTHAFRRAPDGQWFVTPLAAPDWQPVQSSSFPMDRLRFGDFTGDGVTDVLAVVSGRWAISESARSEWRRLNPDLGDAVAPLLIADLDNDNIDDSIRLKTEGGGGTLKLTWWVSDDGRSRWRKLKTFSFGTYAIAASPGLFGFAGRFGAAPGGGVLLTDPDRKGRFFSEAEAGAGASPEWSSVFAY
jgi:hypothetical protein